jgi:glycerophosphoryl diester phosphodiesterase
MNLNVLFSKFSLVNLVLFSFITIAYGQDRSVLASPKVIGHRGIEHHAPENTVANFKASLQLNIGIEVDVRRTKDGVWVCMHDELVDRTTNGKGRVIDYTFSELSKLDAGSYMAPYYKGQRVPKFEDLLKIIKEQKNPNVLIAVDLKVTDETAEKQLVSLARKYGVLDQLIFIGLTILDPSIRRKLHEADSKTQIAVLIQNPVDVPSALKDPHANWAYLRFVPNKDIVNTIRATNRNIFVVGDMVAGHKVENWRLSKVAGVDAVMTEYPFEFRQSIQFIKR